MTQLGVDETSFLRANRAHAIIYATGLVDLRAKVLIDMTRRDPATERKRQAEERQAKKARAAGGKIRTTTPSRRRRA